MRSLMPLSSSSGSSPLARGTLRHFSPGHRAKGLIPARAGNTLRADRAACNPWAHPRSRGEHSTFARRPSTSMGSSPLARGTQLTIIRQTPNPGLIPARAGNTSTLLSRWIAKRAHPRSRGEHISRPLAVSAASGSSPLARGTPPAAGSRGGGAVAHPRSRGEHFDSD